MKRVILSGLLALLGLSAVACNPAVDPAATFTAEGQVVGTTGQPLSGAEVRLIKYSSDLNVFAPSVENLFADSPQNEQDVGLNVSIVARATTGADGRYTMSFKGEDIAAPGGYTTDTGLVEVATTVIVVRDPGDQDKRAGVYSYPYVYQQAAKVWDAGRLDLWASDAKADTSRALSAGLIDLSWKKVTASRATEVKNTYRVTIGSPTTGYLIIRCSEGEEVELGCREDPSDRTKITRAVSAYSVYRFYGGPNFPAYVQANSADYRYVSRFVITAPIPDVTVNRENVTISKIFAAGTGADQDLMIPPAPAIDGNPSTRQNITNNATAIYVQLATGASIADAGILNSLVKDAYRGCVELEFTVEDFASNELAKSSMASQWTRKGKFCGEQGGASEMSALFNLDTSASNGVVAAWMRLRAVPDGAGANPQFLSVGEIAIYKKR